MNDIEKAARLMGYEYSHAGKHKDSHWVLKPDGYSVDTFNPRTNKADLVDLETALRIDIWWFKSRGFVRALCTTESLHSDKTIIADQHRFAARAEAVLSVVSQLYDAKYGKDGE